MKEVAIEEQVQSVPAALSGGDAPPQEPAFSLETNTLLTCTGGLALAASVATWVHSPSMWTLPLNLLGILAGSGLLLIRRITRLDNWSDRHQRLTEAAAAIAAGLVAVNVLIAFGATRSASTLPMLIGLTGLLIGARHIPKLVAVTLGVGIPMHLFGFPAADWAYLLTGTCVSTAVRFRIDTGVHQLKAMLATAQNQQSIRQKVENELQISQRKYLALLQHAKDLIFTLTADGIVVSLNRGFEQVTGFLQGQWVGQPFESLVLPADSANWYEILKAARNGQAIESRPLNLRSASTSPVAIELNLTPQREDGRITGLLGVGRDVTQEKQIEQALLNSEERFALAAQGASDGLWDWNIKQGTVYFSPRWKLMLGCSDDEISGQPEEWFKRVHPEDLKPLRAAILKHLDGKSAHFECTYRLRHKNGAFRWMMAKGVVVRDEAGMAYRMMGSQTDVTQFKMTEQQLLHDAFHDPLTGLANRALFTERLDRAIKVANRRPGYFFALLFLDLDRFKIVNDSLGHEAGDRLLTTTAQRLRECVRPGDVVARLGGDEFTILLEDIVDTGAAVQAAERIQEALRKPFNIHGQEVFSSASIGIATSRTSYEKSVELLRDADIAMYRAKVKGKARYELFDHDMHTRAVEQLQIESDLRRAINRNEFVVHYQPIIELATGEIRGFESLVRWQHPDRGLLMPKSFLPVAEETELIVPLGWWVLREACNQMREWQQNFHINPPLSVSINMAGKQFIQPDFVEQVQSTLESTKLPADCLKIEITEGAIMEDGVIDKMRKLKDLKIELQLDDFGTGYSSLSYLQRFPIDASKIDRSFINTMTKDPESAQIVKAMLSLSHSLGMKVIAEGVEKAEQAAQLRFLKCEFAQGFLYSKPLPADEAEKLVARLFGSKTGRPRQYRLPACG